MSLVKESERLTKKALKQVGEIKAAGRVVWLCDHCGISLPDRAFEGVVCPKCKGPLALEVKSLPLTPMPGDAQALRIGRAVIHAVRKGLEVSVARGKRGEVVLTFVK